MYIFGGCIGRRVRRPEGSLPTCVPGSEARASLAIDVIERKFNRSQQSFTPLLDQHLHLSSAQRDSLMASASHNGGFGSRYTVEHTLWYSSATEESFDSYKTVGGSKWVEQWKPEVGPQPSSLHHTRHKAEWCTQGQFLVFYVPL
jgi:hypothetical protein